VRPAQLLGFFEKWGMNQHSKFIFNEFASMHVFENQFFLVFFFPFFFLNHDMVVSTAHFTHFPAFHRDFQKMKKKNK
jgi:hypothetical protein